MVRFKKDTSDSFFGSFLYDQVIPHDHFLYRLRHEMPWTKICRPLESIYKGGAEYGPTPYHPEKLLRMLLVAFIFNISEREAEETVAYNLPAKYFVGLGVDETPPDHSTLTVFKTRVTEKLGNQIWDTLFQSTITLARKKGIIFGTLQIIDSTHTTANVNREKDRDRQRKDGKPPRDPDASLKTKGQKTVLTKDGKYLTIKDQIYGYKSHTSLNEANNLITSLTITTAKRDDGKEFQALVKKDLRQRISKPEIEKSRRCQIGTTYAADKGYDDGDNHTFLEAKHLHSAIILKTTRLNKQDETHQIWHNLIKTPHYKFGTWRRKRIEKKFGEEKQQHGFDRCRYLGLTKYHIQSYLTAMVVNLKRIMTLTQVSQAPPYFMGAVG
jgi:IS5 family transposase